MIYYKTANKKNEIILKSISIIKMSLNYFKKANILCEEILSVILSKNIYINRKDLLITTNEILNVFIKEQNIFSIGYPLCISLNNETEYFCDFNDNTIIKENDLVKFEFGLSFELKGRVYYYTFGETILNGKVEKTCKKIKTSLIKELNELTLTQEEYDDEEEKDIEYIMTNDEISNTICDVYSKNHVHSLLNITSYVQENGVMKDNNAKYIKVNYRRHNDDYKDNFCMDLENKDVYSLRLLFTKNDIIKEPIIKSTTLYSLNNFHVSLKLKMQKKAQQQLHKLYKNNVFNSSNLPDDIKSYGFNSLINTGILTEYPCSVCEENVYSIKMTLIIENDKIYLL